jgi:hypothetical protein
MARNSCIISREMLLLLLLLVLVLVLLRASACML